MQFITKAESQPKLMKGLQYGWKCDCLHLAQDFQYKGFDTCPFSTETCSRLCIGHSWRGSQVREAREVKTVFYVEDKMSVLNKVCEEIELRNKQAKWEGYSYCFRPNATSDIPFLGHYLSKEFNDIQFYDYTKIPQPWKRIKPNYHLTFSRSGDNDKDCVEALKHGINVAVVFNTLCEHEFPKTLWGYPVEVGDNHDMTFLHPEDNKGPVIIGLKKKGLAKRDCNNSFIMGV